MKTARGFSFLLYVLLGLLAPQLPADSRKSLVIQVDPKGFNASRADILAICRSAADQLLVHMEGLEKTTVAVSRGKHGPIALFKRGNEGQFQVRLDTGKTYWAQYAYQFAHELCHVLCRYENDYAGNLWFEETICEVASLFCLRRMSVEWRRNAPYQNWKSFAPSLRDYTDAIEQERSDYLEIARIGLPAYYHRHARHLTANGTDRPKNGAMALILLAAFERQPHHWNAIRWLNSSPSPKGETFPQYLTKWHQAVPEEHAGFVGSIASLFGITLGQREAPAP